MVHGGRRRVTDNVWRAGAGQRKCKAEAKGVDEL